MSERAEFEGLSTNQANCSHSILTAIESKGREPLSELSRRLLMAQKDLVFLSYARDDLARVKEMYEGLKKRGLTLWFDKVDLGPGPWKPSIFKAIANSRYFVIALSNAALRKTGWEPGFLDEELNTAYQFAKDQPVSEFTIIPALLEDCDRGDYRLSSFQQFDLHQGRDDHLDALALAIGGHKLLDREARDDRPDSQKLTSGLKFHAEAFHWAGDYERALQLWDAVLALEGDSMKAWHNKGNAFRRLCRYDEALAAYDRALSIDREHADTWYNKGNVLCDLALMNYNQALALRPNDLKARQRRDLLAE